VRPSQHPLLLGAVEHFHAAQELDSGYLRPRKRLLVDVFTSPATVDRALALANELFLACEDRSHRVTYAPLDGTYQRTSVDERAAGGRDRGYNPTWHPLRPTVVFIGTVAIGLTVLELSEEHSAPADHQVPAHRAVPRAPTSGATDGLRAELDVPEPCKPLPHGRSRRVNTNGPKHLDHTGDLMNVMSGYDRGTVALTVLLRIIEAWCEARALLATSGRGRPPRANVGKELLAM
jgi:hypothetical protein